MTHEPSPHVSTLLNPLKAEAKRFKHCSSTVPGWHGLKHRSKLAWEKVYLDIQGPTLSVTKNSTDTKEIICLDDCGLVELKNRCVLLNFPSKKKPSYWIFGMTPWLPDDKSIFKFSSVAEAREWKLRVYEASIHSPSCR